MKCNHSKELRNDMLWHPYPEEEPKEAGEYLVARDGLEPYYSIAIWGKSDWLDDYDESMKVLTSYFFEYDSEWGDCIIDDVLAWIPIPKYEKEKTNGHKQRIRLADQRDSQKNPCQRKA